MKIKSRLQLSVIMIIVVAAIVVFTIFGVAKQIGEMNGQLSIIDEIEHGVASLNSVISEYLLHHGSRALVQSQLKYKSLRTLLTNVEFKNPKEVIFFKAVLQNYKKLKTPLDEMSSIFEGRLGLDTEQRKIQQELESRLAGQILVKSQAMVFSANQLHTEIETNLEKNLQRNIWLMSALIAGLALLVGITSIWIYASVVPPIVRLEQGVETLGTGNLDIKIGTNAKDEIGQFSRSFDHMTGRLKKVTASRNELEKEVGERKEAELELEKTVKELHKTLGEIKTLRGIVPICSNCKQIRDDKGYWNMVETYVSKYTDAEFSHSICPDCAKKLYPDFNIYN